MRQQEKSELKACIETFKTLWTRGPHSTQSLYIYLSRHGFLGDRTKEKKKKLQKIYMCAKASGMRGEHRRGLVGGGYVGMYTYLYTYIYIYVCRYSFVPTNVYIHICIYRRACMQAHLYMHVQKE